MGLQSKNFFKMHMVVTKFSMLDLEFPASALELVTLINDIFKLPETLVKKTIKALKTQLWLDFLFMLAGYASIFILCMKVSAKMVSFGHGFFAVLAWVQIISLVCNVIENIYLFYKLHPDPVMSKPVIEKLYLMLEICKWGIALIAAVCCVAALFYFWLRGIYSSDSLYYLLIVIAEITVFLVLKKITTKTEQHCLEEFQQNIQ